MKKDKKNPKSLKRRVAKIMSVALLGLGSAGVLAGCTGDPVDPVWGKGTTLPETGIVGQLFYDTDDNMLFQYTKDGWVEVSEIKGEDGEDGKEFQIRLNETTNAYEYKYDDETEWNVLVDLDDLKGAPGATGAPGAAGTPGANGKNLELKYNSETGYIEWSVAGENDWTELISSTVLKGDKGEKGEKGDQGIQGEKGDQGIQGEKGDQGIQGEKGDQGIQGEKGDQGIQGEKGDTGATISALEWVEDKWGIESYLRVTLNDDNSTVVDSEKVVRVYKNMFYTAESAEDVENLLGYGVEYIRLGADVCIENFDELELSSDLTIDLNEHTLSNTTGNLVVENGVKLVLENGKLELVGVNGDNGVLKVKTNSRLILSNINYETNGTGVFVYGTAASVYVKDSTIVGGTYAIGTNAEKIENHHVVIDVEDSTLISRGYQTADTEAQYYADGAGMLVNVQSNVTIHDSYIEGPRQGLIARAGTISVRDTKLVSTGKYQNRDLYMQGEEWGSGTEVPASAIVCGNNSSNAGYHFPTDITLEGVEFVSKKADMKQIFAWGYGEGEQTHVNVTFISNLEEFESETGELPLIIYGNISLNYVVSTTDGLETASQAKLMLKQMGIDVSVSLENDVVIDTEYMPLELRDFIAEVNKGEYKVVLPETYAYMDFDSAVQASLNEVYEKVYNKLPREQGLTGRKTFTLADIADLGIELENFYIPVAKIGDMNLDGLTMVITNYDNDQPSTRFEAGEEMSVSVGNNNFINCTPFKVENGELFVVCHVLAGELVNTSSQEYSTVEFSFVDESEGYDENMLSIYLPVERANTVYASFNVKSDDSVDHTISPYIQIMSDPRLDGEEVHFIVGDNHTALVVMNNYMNYQNTLVATKQIMRNVDSGNYRVSYGFTDFDVTDMNGNQTFGFYPYYGADLTNEELVAAYEANVIHYTAYINGIGVVEVTFGFEIDGIMNSDDSQNSNVIVSLLAQNVDGSVAVSYKIGAGDYQKAVGGENGGYSFTSDSDCTGDVTTESDIVLNGENSYVVFKCDLVNDGQNPCAVMFAPDFIGENIHVGYSLDDITDYNSALQSNTFGDEGLTIPGRTTGTHTIYLVIAISDLANTASLDSCEFQVAVYPEG